MKKDNYTYKLEESSLYKKNLKIHSRLWIPYTVALFASVIVILIKGIN